MNKIGRGGSFVLFMIIIFLAIVGAIGIEYVKTGGTFGKAIANPYIECSVKFDERCTQKDMVCDVENGECVKELT